MGRNFRNMRRRARNAILDIPTEDLKPIVYGLLAQTTNRTGVNAELVQELFSKSEIGKIETATAAIATEEPTKSAIKRFITIVREYHQANTHPKLLQIVRHYQNERLVRPDQWGPEQTYKNAMHFCMERMHLDHDAAKKLADEATAVLEEVLCDAEDPAVVSIAQNAARIAEDLERIMEGTGLEGAKRYLGVIGLSPFDMDEEPTGAYAHETFKKRQGELITERFFRNAETKLDASRSLVERLSTSGSRAVVRNVLTLFPERDIEELAEEIRIIESHEERNGKQLLETVRLMRHAEHPEDLWRYLVNRPEIYEAINGLKKGSAKDKDVVRFLETDLYAHPKDNYARRIKMLINSGMIENARELATHHTGLLTHETYGELVVLASWDNVRARRSYHAMEEAIAAENDEWAEEVLGVMQDDAIHPNEIYAELEALRKEYRPGKKRMPARTECSWKERVIQRMEKLGITEEDTEGAIDALGKNAKPYIRKIAFTFSPEARWEAIALLNAHGNTAIVQQVAQYEALWDLFEQKANRQPKAFIFDLENTLRIPMLQPHRAAEIAFRLRDDYNPNMRITK